MTASERADCLVYTKESFDELADKIREVTEAKQLGSISDSQQLSSDADLCLLTRSAFSDFHTWVLIVGEIQENAKIFLETAFLKSLALMNEGIYKESVEKRLADFLKTCKKVTEGQCESEFQASASALESQ